MSDQPQQQGSEGATTLDKGKGRAAEPQQDVSMDEADDDSSSEEEEQPEQDEPEEEDEDDMHEIETENIVGGRTRGKVIDYAKAAAENPEDDDEDDEDDEDFEAPEDDEMKD